jgi:hypothetical protein
MKAKPPATAHIAGLGRPLEALRVRGIGRMVRGSLITVKGLFP